MDWWNRFYCNEKRQTFRCECLPFFLYLLVGLDVLDALLY